MPIGLFKLLGVPIDFLWLFDLWNLCFTTVTQLFALSFVAELLLESVFLSVDPYMRYVYSLVFSNLNKCVLGASLVARVPGRLFALYKMCTLAETHVRFSRTLGQLRCGHGVFLNPVVVPCGDFCARIQWAQRRLQPCCRICFAYLFKPVLEDMHSK